MRERERCCYDLQHSFYCRFTDLAEMVCKGRHSTPDRQFNMNDSIDMGETDSDQEDSDLVTDPEDYYMEVRKFSILCSPHFSHYLLQHVENASSVLDKYFLVTTI